ncbi:unnamed protein product [Discula destructiva]
MRVTPCLSKGFWGRSADEFRRLSKIAMNLEGVKGPSGPYELYSFHDQESREGVASFSDADIGGFSNANLDWIPSSQDNKNGHVKFHGKISIELPKNRPDVERSGYAAWRTLDRRRTIFGKSLWDIDPYAYLAMRFKSDGRSYLVNVQTESVVPTDLHQHRLFARRPGEWETVLIKWNDFVRTNHGFVVEPQHELLRQKVRTIGIGLTDRVPGPFEMCVERIWATNDAREGDVVVEPEPAKDGQLKDKEGKIINWAD